MGGLPYSKVKKRGYKGRGEKRRKGKPGIVGHDCNINNKNVANRGSRVEGQPRLYSETMSQKKKKLKLVFLEDLVFTMLLVQ